MKRIFLCLFTDGQYALRSKEEVEEEIKYMEEDSDFELPFTVVGSIVKDQLSEPHMFVIFQPDAKSTIYDVVKASDRSEVESILSSKKRFKGKTIKIQKCVEIKELLNKNE